MWAPGQLLPCSSASLAAGARRPVTGGEKNACMGSAAGEAQRNTGWIGNQIHQTQRHQRKNARSQMVNLAMLFLNDLGTQSVGDFQRLSSCFYPSQDCFCELRVKY